MSNYDEKNKIRPIAFFPPLILMIAVIVFNFLNQEGFYNFMNGVNNWILQNVGWIFSFITVACLIVCIAAFVSPFGKTVIGGADAKPTLSTFSWFCLSLTTTCASGILFWGMAEPISYIGWPPTEINGITAGSAASAKFAMETMYLHWTFLPYSIYTLLTIVFAFMYFNGKKTFSISTMVGPAIGKFGKNKKVSQIIDAMTLFCICAGMAGSLGQVIMNISGGVNTLTGGAQNKTLWLFVCVAITVAVILTSISGIEKGMKLFANINVWGYIAFLIFLFIFGPTSYNFNLGTEAMGGFITHIFEKALTTGAAAGSSWSQWWTIFYWCSWMAWAPTTAIFLGRIAYGRTIRSTIALNLGLNAIVGALWMTIVSGTAIHFEMEGIVDLVASYAKTGAEDIPYLVMKNMPLAVLVIPLFIGLIFFTIVTAVNGNASAMAGLSTSGISPDAPEPPKYLKVVWAVVAPAVAYIMISLFGLDGVKVVANFGGAVAAVIMVGGLISMVKILKNYKQYDVTGSEALEEERQETDKEEI